MSIEYEVRSDDAYSRSASAAEARKILLVRWQVKIDPSGVLLYEADPCRVEIDDVLSEIHAAATTAGGSSPTRGAA